MSAVELPHVPSARAPSSAASSSRRSLHSAGSTASYTSAKSLQRSYGGEGGEDDDEEEEVEEDEEDEEEEPHESSTGSGGLWDEVESFLNKPSPSFVALARDGSKTVGSSSGVRMVLPTITSGERKQPMAPPVGGGNQSGPRSTRAARVHAKQPTASGGSKAIDPKLLQEAFAYAEKIQKVSFDDDDEDESDQQREADKRGSGVGMLRRDSSFGAIGSGSGGPRMPSELKKQGGGSFRSKPEEKAMKKKAKPAAAKPSAYGASVKPQPAKKKSNSGERRLGKDASSEWDASPVSSADPNGEGVTQSRKGSSSSVSMLDQQTVQSLVSNLQNGTALEELRRELAASQQSMAMSRQVIQDAAKSFFHTRK